jgi:dolichol-phosphate mannosyltransferase
VSREKEEKAAPETSSPEISLLVPLYNEEENLEPLLDRIVSVMSGLGRSYEVVLVDDGSTDRTPQRLKDALSVRPHLKAVIFRRNFGQTAAMAAAIEHAKGQILIPLDGDLQNDPADIPKLLAKLEEGFDVASGWRKDRKDPFLTRTLPSKTANALISLISGVPLHDYGCTLKAYRREVLQHVNLMGEMHRFIPVLASWNGAKVAEVVVVHHPRTRGKSKYGLGRTVKVVLDLLTIKFMGSFLTKPIYVFGGSGFALMGLSGLLALVTLWQKFEHGAWVHKNPLFTLAIFFGMAGIQLVMMGLLGELISRIYFTSAGISPYVIREVAESAPMKDER